MAAQEVNPNQELRKSGIYKHPETGAEIEVKNHPKFGDAQAAGIERLGFVFDREVETKVNKTTEEVNQSNESLEDSEAASKAKKGKK